MALLVGAILMFGLGRPRADTAALGLFVVAAAGGYRFADFVRVGLPFVLIVGLVSVTRVPCLSVPLKRRRHRWSKGIREEPLRFGIDIHSWGVYLTGHRHHASRQMG